LTVIGGKIMESIFAQLLENLREAWTGVIDLQPRLDKIESDPRLIQLYPATEAVVLAISEAKIEDAEGLINFCIPYPVVEQIKANLT
jgi:flagellar motor switch protein FliM